jgi:hypothetical protein
MEEIEQTIQDYNNGVFETYWFTDVCLWAFSFELKLKIEDWRLKIEDILQRTTIWSSIWWLQKQVTLSTAGY